MNSIKTLNTIIKHLEKDNYYSCKCSDSLVNDFIKYVNQQNLSWVVTARDGGYFTFANNIDDLF